MIRGVAGWFLGKGLTGMVHPKGIPYGTTREVHVLTGSEIGNEGVYYIGVMYG